MEQLTREFCAENLELVPEALQAGANRIELCDNLAVGGTSPSYGVIRAAVGIAREHGAGVMAMCRPRGADFFYRGPEREALVDDVRCARSLGVTGVVFGCLRAGGHGCAVLDDELVRRLVGEAKDEVGEGIARGTKPVHVTFHMAFDELSGANQLDAIDMLAGLGVERILTHGGPSGTAIEQNLAHLADLVAYAAGRVVIMPGGGVTWQNAQDVADRLGVTEVHGTKVVRLPLCYDS